MTYYVVCWHDGTAEYIDDPRWKESCEDYRDHRAQYEQQDIWTISEDPKVQGWETDSGCSGYGLTYAKAKAMVDILNANLPKVETRD